MVMRSWRFNHIDFSTYPFYNGDDLGVRWQKEKTVFKVWAPTAQKVELRLYHSWQDGNPYLKVFLKPSIVGTWAITLEGDYEGVFYTFRVNDGNWLHEVPDMYARCVGVNGKRGVIYNPSKTDPEGWGDDKRPRYKDFTEAIIYETHIRDFSIDKNSGIQNKGKYLGFTEEGTVSPSGQPTGLSHLNELGVTHVHLLPVFDFSSIDEEKPFEKYNWGYDPQNYNALEGSYSTNPYDGTVRIREFKQLVKALHDNGIGVIMDVVYNHTGLVKGSVFNQFVPGYFYRQNPDGSFANASGCGSEIASERAMVLKFIVDSLTFWIEEYHIDGFRFDLMGVHDVQAMQVIRKKVDEIDSGIFLYGEGWAAAASPMREELRAVKANIHKLPGIAAFSDDMRDALKGNWANKKSKGFVSGQALREESVRFGIVAAIRHPQIVYGYVESSPAPWAVEPSQCINYVSCHDNYTLWDKLRLSNPNAPDEEMRKMVKLAGAIILTSQGVPFLHSGIEFCRTKNGDNNSYKSPDSVNRIDWERKSEYNDVFRYFKSLIQLRKGHPAFRMPMAEQIRRNLNFCLQYKLGIVAYCLDGKEVGDPWGSIVVLFNGNKESKTVSIPEGNYTIIARGKEISENGIGRFTGSEMQVPAISMVILVLKAFQKPL